MATINEQIVALAKEQLGIPYYSMNYNWPKGFGGMGSNYVGRGCGCAQLVSYLFNTILGTRYVGSAWNFAGDALGDGSLNQGGGEFTFVSEAEAHAGDVVLYCKQGYTGRGAQDYGHVAILVSDTEVIGAMGQGKPGEYGYLNIGVSRTKIYGQSLGGPVRYARCGRVKKAQSKLDEEAAKKKAAEEAAKAPTAYSAKLYNSNNTSMQWFNVHKDGDLVRLCSVGRKMWLDVKGAAKAEDTPVRVAKQTKGAGQAWRLIPRDVPHGKYFELEPACAPGMRLDAKGGGTVPKTGLQIHKRNGTPAQLWALVDSEDGNLRILSVKSGLAIDCGSGVQ